jgi:site-specific DNA-methyltransferase (adenine-specific)
MLYNEDCLHTMKRIPDGSIDLMLTDIPYGTTQNEWDILPNLNEMWIEWKRILKPNGVWIFTAQQPIASDLIVSNRKDFRYEWIWEKTQGTGHLNANKMPLKIHENILIFYRQLPTYNPQIIKSLKRVVKRNGLKAKTTNYGDFTEISKSEYDGYMPTDIIQFDRDAEQQHPTQKPVDLFRYLIKTYSNEGETVFDGYMGSGTTAIACLAEKRNYIGSELSNEYFELATKRIENAKLQTSLF